MKYNKLYIAFILSLLALMVYVDSQTPRKVDWNRTFRNNDKNPFGMEVFHKILPELFPGRQVETIRIPPYNHLTENSWPEKSNYVIIDQYLEQGYQTKGLSDPDIEELLFYVSEGNNVFLASNSFPEMLLDTLDLQVKSVSLTPDLKSKIRSEPMPLKVKLKNPAFAGKVAELEKETYEGYFISKDTLDVRVLAVNDSSHANFIRYKLGEGSLFLLSVPEVFCNYYLLKDEKDPVAFKIMSYLPALPTYYDEYTKQGRLGEQSLFRFMRSKPALNWVYYLCLYGMLFYLFFEGKRRQRIIPVLQTKENSTLGFIRTIGQLFHHKKDNLTLAIKKIEFLKWTIYRKTGIRFEAYNEEFREKLIQKTGMEPSETDALLDRMKFIESARNLSDKDLITFNQQVELFYKKTV